MRRALAAAAALLPGIDVDGPRVRLGLAWAAIAVLAILLGPVTTSLVFAAVTLGAAGQACRSWRRQSRRPCRPVAVIGAFACALAGGVGPVAVVAVAAGTAVAAVAATQRRWGGREGDARLTIAIGVLVGVGAASPAVIRDRLGVVAALSFLAWILTIDASMFIVGSGASNRWEGIVAGAASAGAIAIAVAAVLVPPFRGVSPWLLGAVAAMGVPAGTMAATMLVGRDEAPVPALRRLDAYLVVGPVWAVVGRLLLDVV
ncbi:MAG TPA: hypothetical protein VM143_03635 [Acidimicrobiales bacterium]|nr:hypothetical protein [Acidimicrobiales bacterium]